MLVWSTKSDCKSPVQLCNMDKLTGRCLPQASYHTILHYLALCALCTSHRHLHPSLTHLPGCCLANLSSSLSSLFITAFTQAPATNAHIRKHMKTLPSLLCLEVYWPKPIGDQFKPLANSNTPTSLTAFCCCFICANPMLLQCLLVICIYLYLLEICNILDCAATWQKWLLKYNAVRARAATKCYNVI